MDSKVPRKGGRKRKRHDADTDESGATPPPQSEEGPRGAPPERRPARMREKMGIFDRIAESDEFMRKIHTKFMNEKYPNSEKREEGADMKYREVYRRLRSGSSTPDDRVLWADTITRDAVKKVCDMINHLLGSGPLTESEIDILDRCVSLLKAYYTDRTRLIAGNPLNRNYYYRNTYLPPPNTYAYKIFISKYEPPITTLLSSSGESRAE